MCSLLLISFTLCAVTFVRAQTTLTFNLEEERPSNTVVGDIAAQSELAKTLTDQEFRSLQYTLLNHDVNLFSVNKTTGVLTTTSVIDRESICGISKTCEREFGVAINSETFTNINKYYQVKVTIEDKNDNVPKFPTSSVAIEIPENTPVGYQKTLNSATDRDVGVNGIQGYEIVPSNGAFGLNVSKNLDGSYSVKIELKRSVDREAQDRFQFLIRAKDGGNPPNIGTMTLTVTILDVNDNAPEFLPMSFKVDINESVSVNSIILRCTAQDRDINENGRVTYRFSPYQTDIVLIKQTFSIDQDGYIRVIAPLNFGVRNSYVLFVEAMDGGEEPKITQTNITVNVIDTGNNKPVISLRFLKTNDGQSVNVSEGSKLDTAIAHVSIQDSDTGANGDVSCTVQNAMFGLQNVSDNMYFVTLKINLNRESQSTHSVSVICSDKGLPPLSASVFFTVNVMDENDEYPEFNKKVYHATLRENLAVGQTVTQVTASDDDTGNNAIIRYFIDSDSPWKFAINDNTGVITSGMPFDRETQAQVSFRVLAVDSGNPPLTGTATVIVAILDENDNAPKFNVSHYQLYVMEGIDPDSNVGRLSASDIDEGKNAQITYSLAQHTDSNLPFHLFSDGTLKTTATLDREYKDSYTFTIVAYDQGLPMKSSSANVTVIVADTNDNSPVVVFPNDTNDTVSVSYLAPVGSYITTVKAYDRDAPVNSDLTFRILQGNEREIFELDSASGELTMSNTFLIKEDTIFLLDISVTDSGRPARTETCKLRIVLKYANITSVQPLKNESQGKFVIISVIVVVFTVLVSGIILTVIILLRRSDRKRAKELMRQQNEQMYGGLDKNYYTNGGVGYINGDLPKKKKEVSFSLDEELDKSLDITSSSMLVDLSKPQNVQYNPYQNEVANQNNFKQQFESFLINPDRTAPTESNKQKPQHDSTSDTSTEMTASDSGHGSSDMEAPTSANTADDDKHFSYHGYNRSTSYPPLHSSNDRGSNSPHNCTDIYSVSAKHKNNAGLTFRETFERKHGLTSSFRRDNVNNFDPSRPRSEGFTPSYV